MAIQEFEPQDRLVDSEENQSPLEIFKDELHGMVIEVEGSGQPALGHLLIIRTELKGKRVGLMLESGRIEQQLRENPDSAGLIANLCRLQEEQILVYHQAEWVEGYIRDRTLDH